MDKRAIAQQTLAQADRALAARGYGAALSAYRSVLGMGFESWAIHVNTAQCLKRMGALEAAFRHYERAFALKRRPGDWQGPLPPGVAAAEPVSETYLRQLIDQLGWLQAQGQIGWFGGEVASELRFLLAGGGRDRVSPWSKALTQLCAHRVVAEVPEAIMNPAARVTRVPLSGGEGDAFYIFDDVLTPEARAALLAELLGSTYWFDARAERRYLGAHLHDGFSTPLVLALSQAMQAAISARVGQVAMAQLWAFRYLEESGGIDIHADQGDWNLNIWPVDEAQLLEAGGEGGMTLYDLKIGADIPFEQYNARPDLNRERIAAAGAAAHVVPYRGNRAVLFPSRYLHKTNAARFADHHEGRRINVTMMADFA